MEKPNFLPCALLLALTLPSQAALLLYEGFTGYTAGTNLENLAANANTTGIALTGGATYGNGSSGNQPDTLVITNTGMTFGSLVTSGGAITFGTGTNVASIGTTSTTSGTTVWGSYLVSMSSTSSSGSDGMEVRLNTTSTSSSGDAYFRSGADARGASSAGLGVGYDVNLTAGGTLTNGTNYIILSKFNFGPSGGASVWALNSTQFAAFVAADRDESFLTSSNVTAFATDAQTGSFGWNGAFFEIVNQNVTGTLDEIRFGESLLDVTPIPEPASLSLLGAGSLLFLRRRRK